MGLCESSLFAHSFVRAGGYVRGLPRWLGAGRAGKRQNGGRDGES
jgi:hypothetical protein